jgi:hypothetical protein
MIYTAPCVMLLLMRAASFTWQVGEVWALETSSFLGPKWHSPIGSMPCYRTKSTLDFQGPTPSHLPQQNHNARGRINHRFINIYYIMFSEE